jgi:S-DNA-T family DNA segregation ATPase FtsK/SpoIIIE
MAKKKDENGKKQISAASFITGLILCALGLFFFVSFVVYLFKWKQSNTIGALGLGVAEQFVGVFGLGALIIPAILFVIGVRVLRPVRRFGKIFLALLLGVVLMSVAPVYFFYWVDESKTWFGKSLGGSHGLGTVETLIAQIGGVGAGLLIALAIVAYALFLTPARTMEALKALYRRATAAMRNLWQYRPRRTATGKKRKPAPVSCSVEQAAVVPVVVQEDDDDDDDESPFIDPLPDADSGRRNGEQPAELEFETKEIEEEYLPEELLTGELYNPTRDLSGYQRPPVDLLEDYPVSGEKMSSVELNRNKDQIVSVLGQYKIGIEKISATVGPTVTLYEVVPDKGVRIAQIKRLEDDIAMRIAAIGVRIIAPIPGKGTVGIEVPNEKPDIVSMRSIIKSAKFQESKFDLPVVLGKTILGEVYAFDLAKMPHLLVAGATGQGKSVGLNAIIGSLLYKKHPAELKIVMVDPKKVEFTPYKRIENTFLAKLPNEDEPIITDTQKVIYTLKSLCMEMDSRYDLLKTAGVRNIKEYNEKFVNRHLNPLKGHHYMPYIVLIIDEYSDLMMTAGREVEEPIARLAQLARAIGIHLVIATQRPTTNVITGLIKANFPARIAFRVTSMVDSRTILDTPGANQLIGRGDMLVSIGGSDLVRVQCAFIDTPEVDRVTEFISSQPGYGKAYDLPEYVDEKSGEKQIDMKNLDPMFADAAKVIVESQSGSTSLIQRKLSLGYNRAGRIMDQLQAAGIVGPAEGSKPRQVFITDFMSLDSILNSYLKQ